GLFMLPAGLWARLDAGLAATGNWIGVPHLALSGLVAAAVAILFASRIMRFNPVLVVFLGGAAAIAAPALLLRFAQSRYQRRFLEAFPDALDLVRRAVRPGPRAVDAVEL